MKSKPSAYFWIALGFTIIWIGAAGIYIYFKWNVTFPNLQPSEWGEFLAGWSAIMAVIWAFVAVMYQRHQLANETVKATAESEKVAQEAAERKQEHLLKQLGKEILTLAHTCEECELHGPGGESTLLSDDIGKHQLCAEYVHGGQYERLIQDVGDGLQKFVDKICPDRSDNREWSINANDGDMDDLAGDIGLIKGTCRKIIDAVNSGVLVTDCPPKDRLEVFCARADSAFKCVQAIQQECQRLCEM